MYRSFRVHVVHMVWLYIWYRVHIIHDFVVYMWYYVMCSHGIMTCIFIMLFSLYVYV